jgi:hypothetical protein
MIKYKQRNEKGQDEPATCPSLII